VIGTIAALILSLWSLSGVAAADQPPRRIVALNWGLVDTLISLGVPPIAVPEATVYDRYVGGPPLDPDVVNIGLRMEPNLELLSALAPDLILIADEQEKLRPRLERIAPTVNFTTFTAERRPWDNAIKATRDLARLLGREAAGEALITDAEAAFSRVGSETGGGAELPVLVVSFMDARHVRVYGDGSLPKEVLERGGLRSAWTGQTNAWGFATVGIEALAEAPDARLVVIEPVPPGAKSTLDGNPLWRNLPFVAEGRTQTIEPALVFGMVPAAARLADLLADAPP
jgi:iron complex transport system substrate-binding protein